MKISYLFKTSFPLDEIEVALHPANETAKNTIDNAFQQSPKLLGIDPKNSRKILIQLKDIESIEAFAHMSSMTLVNGDQYQLQKTLKELAFLEEQNFFRISNSVILNLKEVKAFSSGSHARLEVVTKSGHQFVVSRHYAKIIRRKLS